MATHFERSCGATAPFVHVVTVHERDTPFPGDDVDEFLFTMRGQPSIALEWARPRELVIRHPGIAADIFVKASRWKDVSIRYAE